MRARRRRIRRAVVFLQRACAGAAVMLLGLVPSALAHPDSAQPEHPAPTAVLAPGWESLAFEAPEPGSYTLPVLAPAPDGPLLNLSGEDTRLLREMGGGLSVLSFIYTHCSDVNGCPLAIAVLRGIRNALASDPAARSRVRLLSVSFDPERDTPEVLSVYARPHVNEAVDWRFLTARSSEALAPLLEAYGQTVTRERDAEGRVLDTYSHILRVFLIDAKHQIRNVYTTSFLHQDTLMADIRTLLLEMNGAGKGPSEQPAGTSAELIGPGDDKSGYDSPNYRTRSRRLDVGTGEAMDLLEFATRKRLGLPPLPVPDASPLSRTRIALGRKLFFDRRLSLNETISCAMCHVPDQGFTVNELATAVGVEGRTVRRNAPTLLNVAYAKRLFHDASENRLEQQVWKPLLMNNEMANPSVGFVIEKLESLPDYRGLFEAAFNGRGPGMESVGMALASYERTLVAAASPFDRWFYGHEDGAISNAARRGFDLFRGKAGCAGCHTIGDTHALFTDHELHNTGIGYARSMSLSTQRQRVQLAPGVFVNIDPSVIADSSEPPPSDLGRYEVTQDPADRWKYRTPTLRNVGLTAPYMHDGSLPTLAAVVAFYNRGGVANPVLDPRIRPLHLGETELADLLAFLGTLDSPEVNDLVTDALAAPIGDRSPDAR